MENEILEQEIDLAREEKKENSRKISKKDKNEK